MVDYNCVKDWGNDIENILIFQVFNFFFFYFEMLIFYYKKIKLEIIKYFQVNKTTA